MTGSEIKLFDSHCHLDRFPRGINIGDLVDRAEKAGIKHFFVPGVTGFPANIVELASFSQITTGWGVHPLYADSFKENCCEEIAQALRKSICRAIGECGLDRRAPVNIKLQQKAFQWQIDLAKEADLPLIVHLVGHYEQAEKMLRAAGPGLKIVIHSFAGSCEIAAKFLDLGAHISFSGSVLRKKPEVLDRLVNLVPQDRLLCETDSPDQRPDFWRQDHNEPAALCQIGQYLADIRHTSLEELSHTMYNNSSLLFANES